MVTSSRLSQELNSQSQDVVEEMSDTEGYERLSRLMQVPKQRISKYDIPNHLKEDATVESGSEDKVSDCEAHVYSLIRKPNQEFSRNNFQLATGITGNSPRIRDDSSRPVSTIVHNEMEEPEEPVVMRKTQLSRKKKRLSPVQIPDSGDAFHENNKDDVVDRLRQEMNILRDTVRRLTIELGKCQTSSDERSRSRDDHLLPGKGPIPPWLTNTRYLNPLLSHYDEKIEHSEKIVRAYEGEMRRVEKKINELIKENERLHLKLEESASANTKTSRSEWEEFMMQAKLVLEENYLLLEELDVQQEKMKNIQREYLAEMNELSKKIIQLECDKNNLENELFKVKHDLSDSESQHEKLTSQFDKIEAETNDQIQGLQRIIGKRSERNSSSMKEMMEKLTKLQLEKKNLSEQLSDSKSERNKLKLQAGELMKQLKQYEKKNELLRKQLDKEMSAQDYLNYVIETATVVANERDKFAETVHHIDSKYRRKLSQLIEDIELKTSIKKNRIPHLRSTEKQHPLGLLKKVVEELIQAFEEQSQKSEERQREISYLQSLIQEKEKHYDLLYSEKRDLETQLSTVWEAHIKE